MPSRVAKGRSSRSATPQWIRADVVHTAPNGYARPSSGQNGADWLVSLISKVPIGRLSVHNHPEQPIGRNVRFCRMAQRGGQLAPCGHASR